MLPVLKMLLVPKVMDIALSTAQHFVKNKVDEKIIEQVVNKVGQQIEEFIVAINRRTIIYSILALVGISVIIANHYIIMSPIVLLTLGCFILCVTSFFTVIAVKKLIAVLSFINNFDENIKEILERELKMVKEEGLHNQIILWLANKKYQEIESLVLSYAVKSFVRWFQNNKMLVPSRIVAYSVVVILLENIVGRLLY